MTGTLSPLSKQQLVNCDTVDSGRNGELLNNGLASDKEEYHVHGDSFFTVTLQQRALAKLQVESWIVHESVTGYVNVPTDGEQNFNVEVTQKSVPISFESDEFSLNHSCLVC